MKAIRFGYYAPHSGARVEFPTQGGGVDKPSDKLCESCRCWIAATSCETG
jgi:hypothetical protein